MSSPWIRIGLTGLVVVLLGWSSILLLNADADPETEMEAAGATLFRTKGCVGCHSGPDVASQLRGFAPDLRELAFIAGERVEGVTAEEYVRQSIAAPDAYRVPGNWASAMPQLSLTADEIDALVAYLLP